MDRTQALVDAVVAQRNESANTDANNRADLAVARARIADLERELAELKQPKE
jgi:uncharacterized protein YceH (UPF0502 family)